MTIQEEKRLAEMNETLKDEYKININMTKTKYQLVADQKQTFT